MFKKILPLLLSFAIVSGVAGTTSPQDSTSQDTLTQSLDQKSTPPCQNGKFKNDISIEQIGNGNIAVRNQNSVKSWITISQVGDDNICTLNQFGAKNDVFAGQWGDDNVTHIGQSVKRGWVNRAQTQQWGHKHVIDVHQDTVSGGNELCIQQLGDQNKLVAASALYVGLGGAAINTSLPATQITGHNLNQLTCKQFGAGNTVGLHQQGNAYNYANILQEGFNNTLAVHQTNHGSGKNVINATQIGSGLAYSVTQVAYTGNCRVKVYQGPCQ